jgi:UDP-glucose 4-epimerase
MSRVRTLVTGGAGFIGSHIVDALLNRGDDVVVLDDLSTGNHDNVDSRATVIQGDVADQAAVIAAVAGCDIVFHQAARKAVLRSVEHPLETDRVNTRGTLNVLVAARDAGARRVINASSSSVYGGLAELPTAETAPVSPQSPYAVSKLAAEHYCRVFTTLYGLETVSLRYFNVFGPRQRPDSTYAAVIPLFIDALRSGRPLEIHGDGGQTRDFTYVFDVVAANLLAADAPPDSAGKVYNVAPGEERSLLDLVGALERIIGVEAKRVHVAPRAGDVRRSRADASAAASDLGFAPQWTFSAGLEATVAWLSAE